jgi:ketosteroid isomerase-like protein
MGTNADVINEAYAAFARGDVPGLLDLMDDGVDWVSPATLPHGGHFTGKDGVLAFFQGIGTIWESLVVEAEGVGEAEDNLVLAVVHAHGELRSGGSGAYGAAHAFTVGNGRITRFREYVDLDAPLAG